ncbi:MAG: alpha/beta hydrolase [Verrucomicrobia bacterium]|nr:alpha/beta hydrolase [Verrucomicrobiota bacterium]
MNFQFIQGATNLGPYLLQGLTSFFTPSDETAPKETAPQNLPTSKPQQCQKECTPNATIGKKISLQTIDKLSLSAIWTVAEKENGPTAILFHGHGNMCNDMALHAKWYHKRGINTLFVTMRGYGESGGDSSNLNELGLYFDVEAAVYYVSRTKAIPMDKIVAHGCSLGGSLAAAAGSFFGAYVTLDHAFTTLAAIKNSPECLPKGIIEGKFQSGKIYSNGEIKLTTDGLSTVEKARKLEKELFIFSGCDDQVMPLSFSDELYEARYGASPSEMQPQERKYYQQSKESHIAVMQGGHWAVFARDEGASQKYAQHLYSIGLMDKKYLSL